MLTLKLFLVLSLVLLLLFGSLVTTEFGEGLSFIIYLIYIAIIPMVVLLLKSKKFYVNKIILIVLLTYVFFSSISALVNNNVNLLATSTLFLLLYLSLGVFVPSILKEYDRKILVLSVLTLSGLIFIPLLLNGLDTMPYQGIFYNTNSFGVVVSTLFTVLMILFLDKAEKYFMRSNKKQIKTKLVLFIFALVICIILAAASGSRTSFITCLIVGVLGTSLLILTLIKHKQIGFFATRVPLLFFLTSIIVLPIWNFTNFNTYVDQNILSKFSRTSGQGDVFNGRTLAWDTIFEETGLFSQSINQLTIAPHNTFLSILSSNGWVPFLLFVLFFIVSVYYSIVYFIKGEGGYRYFPILALASFTLLSMAEIMLYKTSMIIAFVAIGVAVNNNQLLVK